MSVNIRVRDGIEPNNGNGGVNEGGVRGVASDIVIGAGVVDLTGGQLLVHEASSPAMTVVVDKGVGYIPNNSFDYTDFTSIRFWEAVVAGTTGSRTLVIDANSSGQTRIDLICITLDPGATPDEFGSDIAVLAVVKGTSGAGIPVTPTYSLKLAEVEVVNGATEIEDDDITDSRIQVKLNRNYIPDKVVTSITTSATPTLNADTEDELCITALAGATEIKNPTGTLINGKGYILRIKDNGTARNLTWDTMWKGIGLVLPSTTILGKYLYIGAIYNSISNKMDVVAAPQEF